jgi:hypothetical protein
MKLTFAFLAPSTEATLLQRTRVLTLKCMIRKLFPFQIFFNPSSLVKVEKSLFMNGLF